MIYVTLTQLLVLIDRYDARCSIPQFNSQEFCGVSLRHFNRASFIFIFFFIFHSYFIGYFVCQRCRCRLLLSPRFHLMPIKTNFTNVSYSTPCKNTNNNTNNNNNVKVEFFFFIFTGMRKLFESIVVRQFGMHSHVFYYSTEHTFPLS